MGLWGRLKAWLTARRRPSAAARRQRVDPRPAADAGRRPAQARVPTTSDPGAFVKLAERYLGMQMADTALHVCERGIEAHPGHVAGRSLLARIYVAKGMRAEAQQLIDSLVAELGDAPEVEMLKGLMTSGPATPLRGGHGRAAAGATATGDTARRELQALEGYLGRIRRELSRLEPV